MKRSIFYIIFIFFIFNLNAKPFDYLDKFEISESVYIYYSNSNSEIINPISNYHPDQKYILLLKVELTKSKKKYYIYYSPGPSVDHEFMIDNDSDRSNGHLFKTYGEKLYLPGNGSIYIEQRTNKRYNQKRKYSIENDKVVEVPQPFYSINIESKTLKSITLYSDFELNNQLANLTPDYPVTIVGEKFGKYLILTEFGLVGWCGPETGNMSSSFFKELSYWGD